MSTSADRDPAQTTPPGRDYDSAMFDHVVTAVHDLKHPTQIGPYHILQLIGEGGMGIVYKAEQREPIHRTVALKLIKLGMDTRQVIARFESERQALALMNHPHVARVLDAGATDGGRPYFVMEFVHGEPITAFADRHKLSMRQRLELFMQACDAVQHAHQKAIIHRDLKPSNILVMFQDDKPSVKVIDFGVAKAVSQRLTQRTFFTETGQLVGTPEYMAPEQAEANALDVDTRCDVYSLGVVLYELLSGVLPFDSKSLRSMAFNEIQRIIREVDPPSPSARLSTMGERLTSLAASRQIEARKLPSLVRGELDWIVMKAMEKDRSRRYDSPHALGIDLNRYLTDEPVSASPPSSTYRARKFVRRHKWGLGMAAALALALAGGLAGTTWGLLKARHQRDQAISARAAEASAREYEAQTDKFLISMFKSIDPENARGRDVMVKEILDGASRRIDKEPPKHTVVEAYLRSIFGDAYRSLGMLDQALAQLEQSVKIDKPTDAVSQHRLACTLNSLGLTYKELGKLDQAEAALRQAVELDRLSVGGDDLDSITVQANLGAVLLAAAKLSDAEILLAEVLQRVQRASNVDLMLQASVVNDLAMLRAQQSRFVEAEKLLRDGIADTTSRQGSDHPATISLMNNLADVLRQQGKSAAAIEIQVSVLEMSRKVFGADHPTTMLAANNLALSYQNVGRFEESEKLYLDAIERLRRTRGEDTHGTLLTRSNYGLLLQATNRLQAAETTFRDVLRRMTQALGENHPDTLAAQSNLAWLRQVRGDYAESEELYAQLMPRMTQTFGAENPTTVFFGMRYGFVFWRQGKWQQAEPYLATGLQMANRMNVAPPADFLGAYGITLAHVGKAREALPLLKRADTAARAAPKPDLELVKQIANATAIAYDLLGEPDQASVWRQKASSQPVTAP